MTEAEHKVRQCELDVQTAESKEREARAAVESGYARLRAELEAGYERLKEEHQRALVAVEKERVYLLRAKAAVEENGGFVSN